MKTTFTKLQDSTADDWKIISTEYNNYASNLAERLIDHLKLLANDYGGFPVTRLEHCLQTATRALRSGEDDEYIAVSVLHDIGDILCPHNHGQFIAMILKPYISDANFFLLLAHNDFQVYYYNHHLGLEKNIKQRHRNNQYYGYVQRFCEVYDSISFDPNYKSEPLEFFVPYVKKLINKTNYNSTDK